MKLHWLFSNLIVGTIALSMLSMNLALANINPPVRLPPPGCPSDCPDPHEDSYWQNALGRHTDVSNAVYLYHGASAANLNAAATRNVEFAWARINDGTLAAAATTVINAIASGQWNTVALNAKWPYLAQNNFGNVTPQSVIQSVLNSITLAERKTMAAWIQAEGVPYAILEVTNILRQFAAVEDAREHGRILPPVTIPPGWARCVFTSLEIIGTVLITIPPADPIGWVFLAGGWGGNMYMNAQGMIRVIPSIEELEAYHERTILTALP